MSEDNSFDDSNRYFECERINKAVDEEKFTQLKDLVYAQDNLEDYPFDVVEGVKMYLRNYDPSNKSEGRYTHGGGNSFSQTEIINCLQYPEEKRIDYLAYRYKFKEFPRNKVLDSFPIVLAVEPTSVCNIRCTMCFQSDESFSGNPSEMGYMDMDLYKKIIDEASENKLRSLVLASRGEPLLHPQICEMIGYAKEKGIFDIKLNTNATTLTPELSRRLLSAEPNLVVFSLDSAEKEEFEKIRCGANLEEIVSNIRSFKEIRDSEFRGSQTRTRLSMTILSEKQDIEAAKEFYSPLVDEFAVHKAVERLRIYDSHQTNEENPCRLLWERLYVWWDGTVNPCDEDYLSYLSPGKLEGETTISSIWGGDKMEKLRQLHISQMRSKSLPCDRCPRA
ncbi:MAG: radical SAM protein [Candidatus Altiarchaeales archaeon]|nr:radical SAM protein [Candidatus Altiarchaeales archaeon]